MDFSKFKDVPEEDFNMEGSFSCMQEECNRIVSKALLDESTGKVTYRCPKGHRSEFKL